MPKFYDMHVHTDASHDCKCPIDEMARAQLEKGVLGFAVTDHCGGVDGTDIDKSVLSAIKCAEEYKGRTEVLRGIELGEVIWNYDIAKSISEKFELDVIIGSVHAVRYKDMTKPYSYIDFSSVTDEDLHGFMSQYFDDMLEMAENADFDILANLTCPLRYINGKYGLGMDISPFSEKIENILKAVIRKGISLEVNTSGTDTFSDYMPPREVIKKYFDLGGRMVTLGSDAHKAQDASKGFDQGVQMLKDIGFDGIYYYKSRKPVKIKI
ncbi:MAG: PHP domain-containing protein [Clostridia bacterium]|nr:PHP domain-containing protein [Clostridia bacterium]